MEISKLKKNIRFDKDVGEISLHLYNQVFDRYNMKKNQRLHESNTTTKAH